MLDYPGARLLLILFLVTGAGGFGGLLNAVVSGVRPDQPPAAMLNGQPVLVPGSLGNVLVGAAAALISFGLYGPLTNLTVISLGSRSDLPSQGPMPGLTVAALAGAILVGFSGGALADVRGREAVQQGDFRGADANRRVPDHRAAGFGNGDPPFGSVRESRNAGRQYPDPACSYLLCKGAPGAQPNSSGGRNFALIHGNAALRCFPLMSVISWI